MVFTPHSLQKALKKKDLTMFIGERMKIGLISKNLDGNFAYLKNSLIRKIVKVIFFTIFIPFYFLMRHFFG